MASPANVLVKEKKRKEKRRKRRKIREEKRKKKQVLWPHTGDASLEVKRGSWVYIDPALVSVRERACQTLESCMSNNIKI